MRKLKIIAVCGFGIGSSLILKMTIDDMLKAEGIAADSSPQDVTSVAGMQADLLFTSNELYPQVQGKVNCPIVVIENFLDVKEVREKGLELIKQLMAE